MIEVFVYGTLKPYGKYYKTYCQGKTLQEKKCWTKGKLFSLSFGYPAMTKGDDKVHGYLLIFNSTKDLENLDELEGYSGVKNSPLNEYEREKIIVYDDNNSLITKPWAYLMTEEKVKVLNGFFLPSGWW